MEKTKKQFKVSLSILMVVVMLLSCMVFIPISGVSAESDGNNAIMPMSAKQCFPNAPFDINANERYDTTIYLGVAIVELSIRNNNFIWPFKDSLYVDIKEHHNIGVADDIKYVFSVDFYTQGNVSRNEKGGYTKYIDYTYDVNDSYMLVATSHDVAYAIVNMKIIKGSEEYNKRILVCFPDYYVCCNK